MFMFITHHHLVLNTKILDGLNLGVTSLRLRPAFIYSLCSHQMAFSLFRHLLSTLNVSNFSQEQCKWTLITHTQYRSQTPWNSAAYLQTCKT